MQTIARRAGFIAKVQCLVTLRQLAHQLGDCFWRVVELAQIADFPAAPGLRNRHGIPGLGRVDADKCLPISLHGSSPVR